MNKKLKHVGDDIKWSCIAVYEIEGTDYIIEYVLTVFMGIRVTLRKKNSSTLEYNWCAGQNNKAADYLRDVICEIVLKDEIDLYPLCSNIKPFYNDVDFSNKINMVIETPENILQHREQIIN